MATEAKTAPTLEPDDGHDDDDRRAGGGIDPTALLNDAVETIAAEARAHPYRTLGIAFATGYVLGGGVPRFAVRMATTAALRSIGRAILTSDVVVGFARDALGARAPRPRAAAPVKNGARKRGS
jgi:hypothetical protein